jgi:hypothetical protein
MDILTFLTHFLSATAWPAAAIILAVMLRKPLSDLLGEVRTVKWKGLEAEFERRVGQARDLIEHDPRINVVPLTSPFFPEKQRDWLVKLSELSPRSVVLEAWREVESAIDMVSSRLGLATNSEVHGSTSVRAKTLLDKGQISGEEYEVFLILKNLRNEAAHERRFELSKDDALEYAVVAQRLADSLLVLTRDEAHQDG